MYTKQCRLNYLLPHSTRLFEKENFMLWFDYTIITLKFG